MKTFIADIIPKLQRYSQKLDNLTLLTNQHWVSIDNILANKIVYIFRNNNELLVSTNGKVEKAKWEYLGNKSMLILAFVGFSAAELYRKLKTSLLQKDLSFSPIIFRLYEAKP